MRKLKIILRCENNASCTLAERRRIRAAVLATLREEGVAPRCELSVLLTDAGGIRAINRAFRETDRETDVLSFPLGDINPANGRLLLGDMVLNLDRVRAQGEELGHGYRRELQYLTVHSVLHLLGYDHIDEGPEKAAMRAREKIVMRSLGVPDREETEIQP